MTTNGVAASPAASEKSFISTVGYKINGEGKKLAKAKLKKLPIHRKQTDTNGVPKDKAPLSGSTSPVVPQFDDDTMESFPNGQQEPLDMVICKHCKKMILKRTAKDHIAGCLKSKQEKARKKKEAREAAARAKERAERADDDEDDEDDIKDGKGRKALNGEGDAKGKKRKADADDDKDTNKKKKKKEEQKPKAAKPKGPVDVEKQCGVTLPNGQQCARSLTCKSHSMGAKRAVPRSLPYDMLLAAHQKKSQARQQKAAIDANALALYDDELDTMAGPVDSDEERDAIMTAVTRNISRPQPIFSKTLFPTRRKYQLVRMKEMLSNALSGNRSRGLFSVPPDSGRSAYGTSNPNDIFSVPNSTVSTTAGVGMTQPGIKAPSRKASVEVT